MRVPRPSPALVVAFLALLFALGGVAFAATGSPVTIVDPSDARLAAKVDKGKLLVGDGGVPLTVNGRMTVNATTPPGAFFYSTPVNVGGEKLLLDQPTTGAINITAIQVASMSHTSGAAVLLRGWSTTSDCAGARESQTTAYTATTFSGHPHHDVTFTSPLALRPRAGMKQCASVTIPAGWPGPAWVNVSGFRPSMP
jgi:hypothetical protein